MSRFQSYAEYANSYYLNDGLHQRVGQAYFNALHNMHPDIAEQIVGTPIDPYDCDSRLHDFLVAIEEKLDGRTA